MGFTFKGERREYLTVLRGRRRPSWTPIQRNTLVIPGRPGALHQSNTKEIRQLEVPVFIEPNTGENLQKLKEDLAAWLVSETPEELIFDDESDRIYYAYVSGTLDLEEIVDTGTGTITFLCPDPYKYGQKITKPVDGTPILNEGTKESFPLIRATFSQSSSIFTVSNGEKSLQIGEPVSGGETAVQRWERVLYDELSTTTGWAVDSGLAVHNSTVTGTMVSSAGTFVASSYGTGTGWHGPALKKSLPNPLTDFQANANVYLRTISQGELGRIDVYLLDVNSAVVARMTIQDAWKDIEAGVVDYFLGTTTTGKQIYTSTNDKSLYQDFNGTIRIKREGNVWEAYTARLESDGSHSNIRRAVAFKDAEGKYSAQVAQIAIHIAQSGTFPPPANSLSVGMIEVYKINQPTAGQVSTIFNVGDVLEIDTSIPMAYINGVESMQYYSPESDYITLTPGANTLVVPGNIATTEVEYRPRWL